MIKWIRISLVTVIVILIALTIFWVGQAVGATPTSDQYGNPTQPHAQISSKSRSLLPFTGGEFLTLAAGIVLLTGSGFALRKASKPPIRKK